MSNITSTFSREAMKTSWAELWPSLIVFCIDLPINRIKKEEPQLADFQRHEHMNFCFMDTQGNY